MMTSAPAKILIVDDEISVARFIRHSLESNGFQVIEAFSGASALETVIAERPSLIILDYGLPDMTGIDVLKNLREWTKTPVLFLTVRDGENDKVAALDAGADDYLTKPFGVQELQARIRVALRHSPDTQSGAVFKSGALEVDRPSRIVKVDGQEIKLNATEFALLSVLVTYAGKVVPHRTILNDVWGPHSVEHNHYLRVYFGQIRKKMEACSAGSGELIENESGVGYRLKLV